jgi:uncharacterized protein
MQLSVEPRITSFLLKVASRCNLNCDYCYVFNNADQTWRSQPPLMSASIRRAFSQRLAEYCQYKNLENCLVIFHGGEPLLMNVNDIVQTAEWIRQAVPASTKVDFTIQTNGVLLNKEKLEKLSAGNIGISISLDGPKIANDLHRLTHKGKSSFDKTLQAYDLLKHHPDIFTGVLAVVDVRTKPKELLDFFSGIGVSSLDFLLPDSSYNSHPPLRDENPNIYSDWLIEAFDLWINSYPHIKLRTFESLISTLLGQQSGTDFFGFGDVSLLGIETDGTYHDLDVLKITKEGQSHLGMNIISHSILEASLSPKVHLHRKLLSFDGLCNTCKECSVVEVCGGGSVPHRFNGEDFDNPTIYCQEMLTLIPHVQKVLTHLLNTDEEIVTLPNKKNLDVDVDVLNYNTASNNNIDFKKIYNLWGEKSTQQFSSALEYVAQRVPEYSGVVKKIQSASEENFRRISILPSVHLWATVTLNNKKNMLLFDLDEKPVHFDPSYLIHIENHFLSFLDDTFLVHQDDPWLRLPFGSKIHFEDPMFLEEGKKVLYESLEIIKDYNPSLLEEMKLISPVIQFIRDPAAHPDKLVSFSDNVLPGALYVCMRQGSDLADPYDIADSLIHEYRHQKLYLLEHYGPVIVSDFPYVESPWRDEKRPVSGLYHGVFVFHELEKYWRYLSNHPTAIASKAKNTNLASRSMLEEGIETLTSCQLTDMGDVLLKHFSHVLREA